MKCSKCHLLTGNQCIIRGQTSPDSDACDTMRPKLEAEAAAKTIGRDRQQEASTWEATQPKHVS